MGVGAAGGAQVLDFSGQCQGQLLLPALASLIFISLTSIMTSGLETEDTFSVLEAPTSEKPPLPPPFNFQPDLEGQCTSSGSLRPLAQQKGFWVGR